VRRWLVAAVLLGGCGKKGGTTPSCEGAFLAGDLVVSEVMVNPAGDDTGKEWIEVYNAGSDPADLSGLSLVSSAADLTGEKAYSVPSGTIAAGGYVVFSGSAPDLLPDYADFGVGNALAALRNDTGRIALRCGDTVVDEVVYTMVKEAASRAFGGPPDAVANDDPSNWCDGKAEYDTGNKGTPGAANPRCGGGGTTCDDGGTDRPIVFPALGDLVISEVMPDPSKAADDHGEWFELTVLRDVDLNGLEIGATPGNVRVTIEDPACRRRAAGSRLVFARADADNGGLPPLETTFGFGLSNGGGSLSVGVAGHVLDQISWTNAPGGASLQVDPDLIDDIANDDAASWCPGSRPYGLGDKGTPGGENDPCPIVVPAGMCLDGDTLRAIRAPAVGDLIIDELLPDLASADTDKEWFEVLVTRDVDLNGLEIGATVGMVLKTFTASDCLAAAAGDYLVFLHNDGSGTNPDGGLPQVDYRFGFDLVNSNRGIFVAAGGTLLDSVTYTTLPVGASRVLRAGKHDPALNDAVNDDGVWCTATTAYDGTNKGTPGAEDPSCP